jgi:hypothetical protein
MPAEVEPIYSCFCVCGSRECDRFGGTFRCRICRQEIDPFDVYRPPSGWPESLSVESA